MEHAVRTNTTTLPVQSPAAVLIWSHTFFMWDTWDLLQMKEMDLMGISVYALGEDCKKLPSVWELKKNLLFLLTKHSFKPVC